MTKLLEVIGENETQIHCQATVCRTCVFAVPPIIKVSLIKFGIQASTETFCVSCICYQFRADVQKCGHRPQYKEDNDAVQIFVCAKKMSRFCWTVVVASVLRKIRFSSESTGEDYIKVFM